MEAALKAIEPMLEKLIGEKVDEAFEVAYSVGRYEGTQAAGG